MIHIKKHSKLIKNIILFSVITGLFTSLQVNTSLSEPELAYVLRALCMTTGNEDLSLAMTIAIMLFIQVIPLVDIFKKNFAVELWFCLTRYKTRYRWYIKKVGFLTLASFLSCFIYLASCMATLVLNGAISINWCCENRCLLGCLFILRLLYDLILTLFLNIISLLCSVKYTIPIGTIVSLICAMWFRIEQIKQFSYSLNPYSHALFFNHIEMEKYFPTKYILYIFQDMNMSSSIIYLSVVWLLLFIFGMYISRVKDLGLLKEI